MESAATIGSGVEIRLSSIPGGGNGLWTARPFRKNELITEYCGPIIDHQKALKLRRLNRHSHIRVLNCQFLYIDGIKQPRAGAGGASFANDARDTAQNNAAFVCRHDNRLGRDRVYLKAVRDLPPGTEVFVGYGRDYWRNSRQQAAAAPGDQQASGSSSGSGSGSDSDIEEDEDDQQEQAGNLSLSSDEEQEQQQQQQRTRYGARQQQQQRRQHHHHQQQQKVVQQSQPLQELPVQADSQQQQQQVLVSMGQGQWGWVAPGLIQPYAGSGLIQPYAGLLRLGGQPAQHLYMQQTAGDWHHPSTLSHMLPHLHQQPVQDAAEAAALPFEPWQVAAALGAPLAQQRRHEGTQEPAAAAAAAAAAGLPAAAGFDGYVGGGSWDDMQQQWLSWFATHQQCYFDSGDATYGSVGLQQDGAQQPSATDGRGSSLSSSRKKPQKTPRRRSCTSVYKGNRYPLKRAADPYKRVYTHSRVGGTCPTKERPAGAE